MALCFFCKKPLKLKGKISIRESCPACRMDVHVCLNCDFYDPGYSNACRETEAEHVRDRETRNICEYFVLSSSENTGDKTRKAARSKLEELFNKK